MKKKIPYILILAFACIALIFAGLWVHEKSERAAQLEALCENSARQSQEHFAAYQKMGADEDYWYGVSEYNAFLKARILLTDGTDTAKLNRAYGSMVLKAEKVQENTDALLEALNLFAEDLSDPNAVIRLSEFCNAIEHD